MEKKDKDVRFLNLFPGVLESLCKKYGISVEEGEEILDQYFYSLRKALEDWRMPKIVIPLFGTFRPKIWKINHYIRRAIRNYKKGYIQRGEAVRRIKKVWHIRRRLQKEKGFKLTTPKEEHTWYKWRDMGNKYKEEFFTDKNLDEHNS